MDSEKKNKSLLDETLKETCTDTSRFNKGQSQFQEMEAQATSIDSGTIPVSFSFVPSIGTLPSEVLLTKESNYPPKIVSHEGTLMQKPENIPESSLQKNMHESKQSVLKTVHKSAPQNSFQRKECASNYPDNIKHNDLFIAEFVVVMDTDDDEDERFAKKSQTLPFEETKYEFRETLQQSTIGQPKATLAEVKVNEIYVPESHEDCHKVGDPEPQQIFSVPSADLDSYPPPFSNVSHPDTTLGYRRHITKSVPANIHKPKPAVKDISYTPLSSQKSKSYNIITTEPPASSYTRRSLYSPIDLEISEHRSSNLTQIGRSNVLSPLPIQVVKYPLCRSPRPLSSPYFGSSSTICSINESTSSIPKPDAASPASSRLSFLTSLLKSKRSCSKRTISPDPHYQSEPKTISLTSSTFQKSSITSGAPRKAISCFSLNYPRGSRMSKFQRKDELMPSASESDISHGEFSFHQSPNRTLSPDSIQFRSSVSPLLSQKGSVSPCSQLHRRSITPPYSSREYIFSLSDKPPISRQPYTPLKKYSVLGKSKRITLFPPPSHFDQSQLPDERKTDIFHLKRYMSSRGRFRSASHSESSQLHNVMPGSCMDTGKNGGLQVHSAQLCSESMETDPNKYRSLHPSYSCQSSRKSTPLCSLSTNIAPKPRSILSRSCELPSGSSLSQPSDLENTKLYQIKSSYKAFAAIPTNTLLRDQKAIDVPEINTGKSGAEETDTHSEMCSPALLRQQTEEICAAIDEVLHDPFPLSNSASRSANLKSEKKSLHMPRPPLKSAGRETKYATLQTLVNTKAMDPQMTKPGVIRPMAAKEHKHGKFYPNLFQQFSMPPYKRE
ncbi:muscular LMNA-interacting protein isoform 2-T3 [Leptodactylus fuscus]|uniref:muscular LMNA-interacting protein isoform X2 n=1 Tax=Leptodactylus fuscus TaxID=238119 RepID=UPI003F4E486D